MNKKEVRAKVRNLLAEGIAKSEVFAQLSGQGVKDSQIAYFIGSYVDPDRCDEHSRKVNILIAIMFIQAVIAFIFGFVIVALIGPHAKWIVGGLAAIVPLLFVWGFYGYRVGAYNTYIFIALFQLPKSFEGFAARPSGTIIAVAINVAVLAYVWYVRFKLFPDLFVFGPKKIKGKYVFSE